MHCDQFSTTQRLSDWPECRIEVRCTCSPRVVVLPVKYLIERSGDRTFTALTRAVRCKACGGKPAPVYLVAGQNRIFNYGAPPAWSVELIPPPKSDP